MAKIQNEMTTDELKKAYKEELERSIQTQLKQAGIEFKTQVMFSESRKWRFDIGLTKNNHKHQRVLIDIQGGTWSGGAHVRGKGYENDVDKMNAATALGFEVYWFTGKQVKDGRAIAFILDYILK